MKELLNKITDPNEAFLESIIPPLKKLRKDDSPMTKPSRDKRRKKNRLKNRKAKRQRRKNKHK